MKTTHAYFSTVLKMRSLLEFARLFENAPSNKRSTGRGSSLTVLGDGNCIFTCMVVAGFLAFTAQLPTYPAIGYIMKSDLQVVIQFMEFMAPVLKILFHRWIQDHQDVTLPAFKDIGWSVRQVFEMYWNTPPENFEDHLARYGEASVFGSNAELEILCHLCPGLCVQIVQKSTKQEHTRIGAKDNPSHTIFLKHENPSSETKCHYNMLLWDLVSSRQ